MCVCVYNFYGFIAFWFKLALEFEIVIKFDNIFQIMFKHLLFQIRIDIIFHIKYFSSILMDYVRLSK